MIEIERYTAEEWSEYSSECHQLVFKEIRDRSLDRISFAYILGDDVGPIGYVTFRELDSESVYMQYGGAIESRRGFAAVKAFDFFMQDIWKDYKRVSTYVENENIGYLHLLMKKGFRAIGMRTFDGKIYLEMYKEK